MQHLLNRQLNWRFPIYLLRSFEKFYRDLGSFHAATLTFYTLFALVPFLGLMFGVAQSFGLEQRLKDLLKELLIGQDEVYHHLLVFTENILGQTREEWIAGIGLVFLIWSVYKVLRVLDHIFAQIWSIRFQKNSLRRAQQMISLMLLAPIALIILGSVIVEGLNTLQIYLPTEVFPILPSLLITQADFVIVVLFTLLFGLSYWAIPSVPVPLIPALSAGLFASLLFHALQVIYVVFQSSITQYGVVYGSFASVPLFMLWIYFSWVIYLLGAELTYILESRITHRWELQLDALPVRLQRALAVEMMDVIKKRFEEDEPALSTVELAQHLSISIALTRKIVDLLIVADLITMTHSKQHGSNCYLPKRGVKWLNKDYVINALEGAAWVGTGANSKRVRAMIDELETKQEHGPKE